MKKDHILVIGAGGQIGAVLTEALREVHGANQIIACDLRPLPDQDGPTAVLDATDGAALEELVRMKTLFNVLEIARQRSLKKVYFPSSIAVFGREAAHQSTPQYEVLIPETVYGISKVAGENWCNYYYRRYGVDVRSLRYPGIIGYQSMPGGGTTDYAVEIYHAAVKGETYACFLSAHTCLPMLYMPDAIRGTLELMEAPANRISVRTSYNLAGMTFAPADVAASIQKIVPDFKIAYQPDFRQAIADSWPQSIDDQLARKDWNWQPEYDLEAMTEDMLLHLRLQGSKNQSIG
jgi:threonine 3-dehydrogenase